MQLDAEEDGEPFFKPPAVNAAPIGKPDDPPTVEEHQRQPQNDDGAIDADATERATAAIATVGQED